MHKQPSAVDFALGHRANIALTTGALAATCLAWAQSAVSWFVPLLALALCRTAFVARRKVEEWTHYRAEFDEMGRPQPRAALPYGMPGAPGERYPEPDPVPAPSPVRERSQTPRQALLVTWALLLYWLWTQQKQPSTALYGAAALLFLAITALGVGIIALGAFRPARPIRVDRSAVGSGRAQSAPTVGDHVVSQVLPVSPDLLPDYVQSLLKRDEPPR
jgi:hypothetical protein